MRPIVFALVLATAGAVTANAQSPYRQTVVVTAAAVPIELGSATRTLTVITREQIAQLPAASVADVLRLAASVDVRARGAGGMQTDFAIRGAGFGQMLVLVDGVRINDAQSGHHNGDIPVPLELVERIEVLYGAGSSLFGADAFGGTINVITRRGVTSPALSIRGARFGRFSADGAAGFRTGPVSQTIGVSLDRSSGFIDGRDYLGGTARLQATIGSSSGVSVSWLAREFGARNFYGATASGDALSREWTNQLLIAADHRFGTALGWTLGADGSYRTHGDRFRFTPSSRANVHRTHEALGTLSATRTVAGAGRLTLGVEAGGTWIASTNLGDHSSSRVSALVEWRQAFARRLELDASLRADHYDPFGASWSPSAGIAWWPLPVMRLRTSAGRAFRVPTFTERYYADPNHQARPEIGPERSWGGDVGIDLFPAGHWTLHATAFRRMDTDVIDWLCADRTCGRGGPERWHTFNVHEVKATGAELSLRRTFAAGAFVLVEYTGLRVEVPPIAAMAKYTTDYSPRALTAAASWPSPAGLVLAPRLGIRRRTNITGTTDQVVLDARVSRALSPAVRLMVDGTNLLGARYDEIPGVRMPGRAVGVALELRGR